jgi:CRISPR/Cas system-associated exonuclease Cas4 (RecB family)
MNIQQIIDKHHEDQPQDARFHFGVSGIGEKCERKLWMNFRWCKTEQFSGRILRLFRRGHMEELTIAKDLIDSGFDVQNFGEDQTKVDFGCHISSEVDGIVILKDKEMVLECKTSSDKQFQKVKKEGIKKAKPLHYVQCNIYCYGLGLDSALYYVVNKNDDEIYTEIVEADFSVAEEYLERAKRIATQDELPHKITENPSWWECKFCNYHGFCHKKEEITNKNCRTCSWSTSMEDGTWYCEKHHGSIDEVTQLSGCDKYELHDNLVKEK